jgi:hypothetical protein
MTELPVETFKKNVKALAIARDALDKGYSIF